MIILLVIQTVYQYSDYRDENEKAGRLVVDEFHNDIWTNMRYFGIYIYAYACVTIYYQAFRTLK